MLDSVSTEDIRFAKDKSPYKLQVSSSIAPAGRKDRYHPGFYIQIGVGDFWIGEGCYDLDKNQLVQIRRYISQHIGEFESIINHPLFLQYYPTGILGAAHKRIPKEFMMTSLIISQKHLIDWVLEHYKAAIPVTRFLKSALES